MATFPAMIYAGVILYAKEHHYTFFMGIRWILPPKGYKCKDCVIYSYFGGPVAIAIVCPASSLYDANIVEIVGNILSECAVDFGIT